MKALLDKLRIRLRIGGVREPMERTFRRFRDVLDSNNRSLEIMADMGEVLGGDYLFDIQYVRRTYAALTEAVERSLADFDALTHGRHRRIGDVYRRIDGMIRSAVEQLPQQAPRDLVISFRRLNGESASYAGGKNANLGELRNVLGLSVPDGFAVTTAAFDEYLRRNRVLERLGAPAPAGGYTGTALEEAREAVLHGEMPPSLSREIERALAKLRARSGKDCFLAVRSSAVEEDGDFSFAGQFETELNVPADPADVEQAYRRVVSSLFTPRSEAYHRRLGYDLRNMRMAVGCVVMVDAAVSGVLYSANPDGDPSSIVINATWGLGTAVVEGTTDSDYFRVEKDRPWTVREQRIGAKTARVVRLPGGGIGTVPAGPEAGRPSLDPAQVAVLAETARKIELHFRRPQDIEWAIDGAGSVHFLQSRPLRLEISREGLPEERVTPADEPPPVTYAGRPVYKGVAAGTVHVLRNINDLEAVPQGAILVARHDSSNLVTIMPRVAAIITDTGAPTSHMASLCREFRIPTLVNAGDLTRRLSDGQQVTVQVGDEGVAFYDGTVRRLLDRNVSSRMEDLLEFRKKRYLLRFITPLNLVDPLRDEFTPKACRTFHDILRFVHEKSVGELIDRAGHGRRSGAGARLELPVPAGLTVIDIGDGLRRRDGSGTVTLDDVTSLPLRAVVSGMIHPGLWRSDAVPLKVGDFMTSMLRAQDILADVGDAGANVAVVSREYANVSLKFGYHFIILDCYRSETARNNHVYFRFVGGATDIVKRSRRLELIGKVLSARGFRVKTKGDLIVARQANIRPAEMDELLTDLGRLISYTRQLDAFMHDDASVDLYAESFLRGDYRAGQLK